MGIWISGFGIEVGKMECSGQNVMLEIYNVDCLQLLLLPIAQIKELAFRLVNNCSQKEEEWNSTQ